MNAVRISERDSVATVIEAIAPGQTVAFAGGSVTALEEIPIYHKIAIRALAQGEPIVKYGEHIGVAACPIPAGSHVHTHNVESRREALG